MLMMFLSLVIAISKISFFEQCRYKGGFCKYEALWNCSRADKGHWKNLLFLRYLCELSKTLEMLCFPKYQEKLNIDSIF